MCSLNMLQRIGHTRDREERTPRNFGSRIPTPPPAVPDLAFDLSDFLREEFDVADPQCAAASPRRVPAKAHRAINAANRSSTSSRSVPNLVFFLDAHGLGCLGLPRQRHLGRDVVA